MAVHCGVYIFCTFEFEPRFSSRFCFTLNLNLNLKPALRFELNGTR